MKDKMDLLLKYIVMAMIILFLIVIGVGFIMSLVLGTAMAWTYVASIGAAFFTGTDLIFYYIVFLTLIINLAFSNEVKKFVEQIKR